MIIVRISSGMGNQLFQYAAGRQLANKLNTELKLDITFFDKCHQTTYILDQFNITGKIATPEEIEPLKKICMNTGLGKENHDPIQKVLNYPDNIYLDGFWCTDQYFPDIRDILLKEFTLKNPLSPSAEACKQKILAAECAVGMHFRHGDYLYQPTYVNKPWFHVPPLEYYHNCINTLKQAYKNLTAFVFSDNMQWVQENLHLDVPTEFFGGKQKDTRFDNFSKRDVEEMYLMSICKHIIKPTSSFSWWASYLNQNPDKKIFVSFSSTAQEVLKYKYSLKMNETAPLESAKWMRVPFDRDKQPKVTAHPIYSLLLVVNNDADTISETLDSILGQDYKYYEIIIIDNASTDGSGKICQQAIAGKENVTFKKLWTKVKNAEAWNMALDIAQGYYCLFLKGNDRLLAHALSTLYHLFERRQQDILHCLFWLMEDDKGNIIFGAKKCSEQRDAHSATIKNAVRSTDGQEAVRFLLNKHINNFLGTKLYNRAFLLDNGIKFNESLDDNKAEFFFQMECFFKAKDFFYAPNALYIVPKNYLEQHPSATVPVKYSEDAQIVSKFKDYFTARVDLRMPPQTADGNFQILSVSDGKSILREMHWVRKGEVGYWIHSYVGNLEIVIKAIVSGRINLHLRGIDIRDPKDNSKRIPYWIDYTKLTVGGQNNILNTLTPTWHDKPYTYIIDAKANEEIKIQVEWLPHIDDAIDKVVAPTPKPPVADKAVAPAPKPPVADKAVAPAPKPPVADKAVAPAPKPPVADKVDAQMIDEFKRYFTARVNVQMTSPKIEGGDFQLLSVSDNKAAVKNMHWLPKGYIGYSIESYVGNLEIVAKPTMDNQIQLLLRGLYVSDPKDDSKRIPYWIDYTKLIINGKVIFDQITPAWHDKSYRYNIDAKAGEEVKIKVEWLPHKNYISDKVVAPTPKPPVADKVVAPTPKPPVADKVVAPTPKPPVADKAVAPAPKPPVADKAVAPAPKPPVADKVVAPAPKPPVADKVVAPAPKPPVADKVVAPTPKPPVADKVDEQIINKFKRYFTARINIKLMSVEGDFQILSVSDNRAIIKKPNWYQKSGVGYQINSYSGKLEITAKGTADGRVNLHLRGIDIRDPKDNSKRIPYWIDYTKLTINGKEILNKRTPTWHNKPYRYHMDVKANEEIKIQIEWLPHNN